MPFRVRFCIVFIALFFFPPLSGEILAKEAKPIYQFDLFGFQASQMTREEMGLNERMIYLSKALYKKIKNPFFKSYDFIGKQKEFDGTGGVFYSDVYNSSGRACLMVEKKNYEIFWKNSETEGFTYGVTEIRDQEPCGSKFFYSSRQTPFNNPSKPLEEIPQMSLPKLPALSDHFPQIQLGISTPSSIENKLGPAYCSGKDKLIYVLKRSLKAEKNCWGGAETKCSSGMKGILVEFSLLNGFLKQITIFNSLTGEC